ncbi:ribosomal protein RPL28 [Babesia ovata]|uniref:Large ribosomal subunit protein bL28c n=1 Tax=Babesia ovata TaxID=189622 RepID=A0A2H6KCU9_9APIC|nr:ribosomal protein RPL28 [Babesia ovata]GBE60821.1 ribosomal protein RPL28 [Babesia ovata]
MRLASIYRNKYIVLSPAGAEYRGSTGLVYLTDCRWIVSAVCHIFGEASQGSTSGMSLPSAAHVRQGKKFRTVGRSSQIKHYRIVGRGGGIPRLHKVSGMPTKRIALPARRCMLLGKMDNTKARSISHSGKRTHRAQKVNLQWKRIWCISKGHYVRLRLSMKGLKTIKRFGLEEAARRFNLNLNNPKLFAGYANLKPKKPKEEIVEHEYFLEDIPIDS